MRTSEPLLFDTNVLIYNQDLESSLYTQAADYHERAFSGKITGVISSQNLLELVAVITNPKRITKPLSLKQASGEVKKYLSTPSFTVIYPNDTTMDIVTKLLNRYHLKHPIQTFDLFLVATMLSNGIKTILTANDQDFRLFKEVKVIRLS